jgi:hypothetical protein
MTSTLILEVNIPIRDVAWCGDDTLLATDGEGAIWRFVLPPLEGSPSCTKKVQGTLLHKGRTVLAPVREAYVNIKGPAAGTYPLIAVAPGGAIVVCTHDMVLVAHRPGEAGFRLLTMMWGLYYPELTFSADGLLCLAQEGVVWGFELVTGNTLSGLGREREVASWHPEHPWCLSYDFSGELFEWRDGNEHSLGRAPWIAGAEAGLEDCPEALFWRGEDGLDVVLCETVLTLLTFDAGGTCVGRIQLPKAQDVYPEGPDVFWEKRYNGSHICWRRVDESWSKVAFVPSTYRQPRLHPDGGCWLALDPLPTNPYPSDRTPTSLRKITLWSHKSMM